MFNKLAVRTSFLVSENIYHYFIKILNYAIRDLTRLQTFGTVPFSTIRYINSPCENAFTQKSSTIQSSCDDTAFIQLSPSTCFSVPQSGCGCEFLSECADSASFATAYGQTDYYEAIQAMTDVEVNPSRATSTTYNSYRRLCYALRIRFPHYQDVSRCVTCGKKDDCKCVRHTFHYLQSVPCECRTGHLGFCVCDDYPEIFYDLDELREIQGSIIDHLFSSVFTVSIYLDEPRVSTCHPYILKVCCVRLIIGSDIRKCSDFRPP